jgi:hypothetical protein
MERKILNYKDVMELLKCKKNKAYEIIKVLNIELKNQGFLTINGKIPINYLLNRLNIQ